MKKNLIYFLALLFLGFMTSCTDDEDPAASTPTIAFSGVPEGEVTQGQFTEDIKALVSAPEKIESFVVTVPYPTQAGVVEVTTDLAQDPSTQPAIDNIDYHTPTHIALLGDAKGYKDVSGAKNYTVTISQLVLNGLTSGTYTVSMKVTDKEGMSTTETESITVAATVEPAVTVAFKVGEDDVTDSVTVDHGTVLTIVPTSNVDAAIKSVTVNGTAVEAVDNAYSYTLAASGTYTVVATDENDVVSEETVIKAGLNLTVAQALTWERAGGADATGLEKYGLAWTSNSATNAIVKAGSTTKLVQLNSDDWAGVVTQSQLAAVVMATDGIAQYEGISVTATADYDDVLATEVTAEDGSKTYFLIHITRGVVDTSDANVGTVVTVTGESKDDLYNTIVD